MDLNLHSNCGSKASELAYLNTWHWFCRLLFVFGFRVLRDVGRSLWRAHGACTEDCFVIREGCRIAGAAFRIGSLSLSLSLSIHDLNGQPPENYDRMWFLHLKIDGLANKDQYTLAKHNLWRCPTSQLLTDSEVCSRARPFGSIPSWQSQLASLAPSVLKPGTLRGLGPHVERQSTWDGKKPPMTYDLSQGVFSRFHPYACAILHRPVLGSQLASVDSDSLLCSQVLKIPPVASLADVTEAYHQQALRLGHQKASNDKRISRVATVPRVLSFVPRVDRICKVVLKGSPYHGFNMFQSFAPGESRASRKVAPWIWTGGSRGCTDLELTRLGLMKSYEAISCAKCSHPWQSTQRRQLLTSFWFPWTVQMCAVGTSIWNRSSSDFCPDTLGSKNLNSEIQMPKVSNRLT